MMFKWTFLITYLLFHIRVVFIIWNTDFLEKKQKIINIILTLLIPFIFGGLVLSILKRNETGTSSSEYRKNKRKNEYKNHGNGAY